MKFFFDACVRSRGYCDTTPMEGLQHVFSPREMRRVPADPLPFHECGAYRSARSRQLPDELVIHAERGLASERGMFDRVHARVEREPDSVAAVGMRRDRTPAAVRFANDGPDGLRAELQFARI